MGQDRTRTRTRISSLFREPGCCGQERAHQDPGDGKCRRPAGRGRRGWLVHVSLAGGVLHGFVLEPGCKIRNALDEVTFVVVHASVFVLSLDKTLFVHDEEFVGGGAWHKMGMAFGKVRPSLHHKVREHLVTIIFFVQRLIDAGHVRPSPDGKQLQSVSSAKIVISLIRKSKAGVESVDTNTLFAS